MQVAPPTSRQSPLPPQWNWPLQGWRRLTFAALVAALPVFVWFASLHGARFSDVAAELHEPARESEPGVPVVSDATAALLDTIAAKTKTIAPYPAPAPAVPTPAVAIATATATATNSGSASATGIGSGNGAPTAIAIATATAAKIVISTASAPASASSVEWLFDPYWQGFRLGQQSRMALFREVELQSPSGTATATGAAGAVRNGTGMGRGVVRFSRLPDAVWARVEAGTLPWSGWSYDATQETLACQGGRVTGPALLLKSHVASNTFHVHNDMFLRIAWLLRTFQLAASETTLLLQQGTDTGAKPTQLFGLAQLLFSRVLLPGDTESALDTGTCFAQLYWTPLFKGGLECVSAFYCTEAPGFNFPRVTNFWASLVLGHLGLGSLEVQAKNNPPQLLWIQRGLKEPRAILNFDTVLLPALEKSFRVHIPEFGNASKGDLRQLLASIHAADVIGGAHGQGLTHAIYARPGTLLLELKTSLDLFFYRRLFQNVAMSRGLPYYASSIRPFLVAAGTVKDSYRVTPEYAERLRLGLAEAVAKHASAPAPASLSAKFGPEPGWHRNGASCAPGGRLLTSDVPQDGQLTGFAQAHCYLLRLPKTNLTWAAVDTDDPALITKRYGRGDEPGGGLAARLWAAAKAQAQPEASGEDIRDVCKRLQKPQGTGGSSLQGLGRDAPVVINQRYTGSESMRSWFGNAIAFYYLPRTLAVMARVPHVFVPSSPELLEQPQDFMSMISPVHVPDEAESEGEAQVLARVRAAAARVCRCHEGGQLPHLCRDTEVWRVFQGLWRQELRTALTAFLDFRAEAEGEATLQQEAAVQADLAVHLRCGDLWKYRMPEYGYLPLSAYRTVTKGRDPRVPLKVLVVSSASRGKDREFAAACQELLSGFMKMLEVGLAPAEVRLDVDGAAAKGQRDGKGQSGGRVERTWAFGYGIGLSWLHLVFAKRTVCNPSTFCLWPTLAANSGYLADTPLFFSGTRPPLQGVTYLVGTPFLNLRQMREGNYGPKQIVEWMASH